MNAVNKDPRAGLASGSPFTEAAEARSLRATL
jgi:hypothetical protein